MPCPRVFQVKLSLCPLYRKQRIEGDSDYCGNSYSRKLDAANLQTSRSVSDSHSKHKDESGDYHVPVVGKINLVLYNVADTDCGYHTIENERDSTYSC